eukprot:5865842-Karenia_brevis.AAC.1
MHIRPLQVVACCYDDGGSRLTQYHQLLHKIYLGMQPRGAMHDVSQLSASCRPSKKCVKAGEAPMQGVVAVAARAP